MQVANGKNKTIKENISFLINIFEEFFIFTIGFRSTRLPRTYQGRGGFNGFKPLPLY